MFTSQFNPPFFGNISTFAFPPSYTGNQPPTGPYLSQFNPSFQLSAPMSNFMPILPQPQLFPWPFPDIAHSLIIKTLKYKLLAMEKSTTQPYYGSWI